MNTLVFLGEWKNKKKKINLGKEEEAEGKLICWSCGGVGHSSNNCHSDSEEMLEETGSLSLAAAPCAENEENNNESPMDTSQLLKKQITREITRLATEEAQLALQLAAEQVSAARKKQRDNLRQRISQFKKEGGKLTVFILAAKNIPPASNASNKKNKELADCCIHIKYENKKHISKTVRRSLTPNFSEKFEFSIQRWDKTIDIRLFDVRNMLSKRLIGAITLTIREVCEFVMEERDVWVSLDPKDKGKKLTRSPSLRMIFQVHNHPKNLEQRPCMQGIEICWSCGHAGHDSTHCPDDDDGNKMDSGQYLDQTQVLPELFRRHTKVSLQLQNARERLSVPSDTG